MSASTVASMVGDPEVPEHLSGSTVNLKQAASILGVHYMTAYRYVRQGRLVATREGTEWRVPSAALDSFVTGAAPRSRSEGSDDSATAWCERMESCLLASDETAAWRVLELALSAGHDPAFCYLDMIAAALASIGDRWAGGEIDIADQHLATAVAIRLVARLGARFRRPGRSRGTVVFGAPRGELHILPIAIVADLVRLQRYDVLELGADVPTEAFVVSASRTPRLICVGIGITRPELVGVTQEVVDAIRAVKADIPIVVGGLATKGLDHTALRDVTAVAEGGRDAVAIIESFASTRAIRSVM